MSEIYIKVGVIIENEKGEILLLKEKIDEQSPPAWNVVKGTYELEDGSIEECAKRECLEETGLEAELLGINNIMFFPKEDKLKIQYNFIARPYRGGISLPSDRNLKIEGENIERLAWMKPEEILQMNSSDFVADYTLSILQDWIDTRKIYPLEILKYSKGNE